MGLAILLPFCPACAFRERVRQGLVSCVGVILRGYHRRRIARAGNLDFIPILAGKLDGILTKGAIHERLHQGAERPEKLHLSFQWQIKVRYVMEISREIVFVTHGRLLSVRSPEQSGRIYDLKAKY
jgi:hypothetical protein